ncbi:uncharacterized protein ALTATR162_LOCUS2544 [Alternaria atra]|uniref:Clr5 domain-containing protein n=1 Tax=Alternaria atra TaxID=119953 RepID=A0A8J2HZC5_9PLEO|nr:uncharacterized protein ALTATR162_LOCUS2544 [Alternaria atra]CAG5150088.1 unnamed protein product [Alternaria atra]
MPKQTKSYATRIPPSTWERHRHRIETLFLHENKTLSDVMGMMKGHGFYASESQYERQLKVWGIRKNWKKGDWSRIAHYLGRIDELKEETAVVIDGLKQLREVLVNQIASINGPKHNSFSSSYFDLVIGFADITAACLEGVSRAVGHLESWLGRPPSRDD